MEEKQVLRKYPTGIVYIVGSKKHRLYKIGSTTRSLEARLSEFSPKLPFEIEVFAVIKSDNAPRMEEYLHKKYRSKKFRDDWHVLSKNELEELIRMEAYEWRLGKSPGVFYGNIFNG